MNNERLSYLYQQYIDNQCTGTELHELKQLLNQHEYWQYWVKLLDNTCDKLQDAAFDDISKTKADEIYLSIIRHPQIRRKPAYKWIGVAATLVIAVAFSLFFYNLNHAVSQPKFVAVKTVSKPADVLPGSDKAVLTLENGRKVILDDARNGRVATQINAVIRKVGGGLVYESVNPSAKNIAQNNLNNTLNIPKGGQYQVTLSDGTQVFLNAESELTYPVKFSGTARMVTLKGEAYFEVTKNPKMPFKVNVVGKQQIEVLGTHFNVKAYPDEAAVNTTLLEGSVKISSLKKQVILKPGQMSVNNLNKKLLIKTADVAEVMAWKNGEFIFDNDNITSIMRQVSRWYNVDVAFVGKLNNINFTGNYSRSKSLLNLLKNIELIKKVHFITEGRRVTVVAK